MQNHGDGQKSRHTRNITLFTVSGVSEQFLDGTSAQNRPFQCHYMVLRLKMKYT